MLSKRNRLFAFLIIAFLLFTSMPFLTFNVSANSFVGGEVTFVGQWVNESSQKIDTVRNFDSANDILGEPENNPGLLKGLAKIFLGWSDKAPVENGKLADGARLFSANDKISLVFPDGIPENAKIYGVYWSVNAPDSAFSNFSVFSFSGIANKMKEDLDRTTISINKGVAGTDILPGAEIVSDAFSTVDYSREIVAKYAKKNDTSSINEITLKSEFTMDDTIAMLVYKNKAGSNAIRPVLSYDYNVRYSDNGEFSTADGDNAGYTYVDLIAELDERVSVPETLYMEFSSYSWRPLYLFGGDDKTTPLEVVDPNTGSVLGNNKGSFASLVKNDTPKVVYAFKTNGNHKITMRVVLREGDKEKISESVVVPAENQSIAEKILENMTWSTLSANELKNTFNISTDEVNSKVLYIPDAVALQLGEEGTDNITIKGKIAGYVVANAGSVSLPIFGNTSLKSAAEISNNASNTILFDYQVYKYNVEYSFVSNTSDNLPEEVLSKLPQNQLGKLSGDKVKLPTFDDVSVKEGVWSFIGWTGFENTNLENDVITIADQNINLVGHWELKKPEPTQREDDKDKDKDKDKTRVDGGSENNLPSTGVDNNIIVLCFIIIVIMGTTIYFVNKKRI